MRPARLLAGALAVAACEPDEERLAWLIVEAPPGSGIELAGAQVSPEARVARSYVDGRRLLLTLEARSSVRVRAPSACPLDVGAHELRDGATVRRSVRPWFTIEGATEQAGFGNTVELRVVAGCGEAEGGQVDWTQLSGPELREAHVAEQGRRWQARLPELTALLAPPLAWGVIALSPRTRGAVELEAAWQSEGRETVTRRVRIAASPPLSGLPNLAVGTRVPLGGEGWQLVQRPRRSAATLELGADISHLTTDVAGNYRLKDATGAELELRAARYDATPLDCGRATCHGEIVRAALDSPMTSVLARTLGADKRRASCELACHAAGTPGAEDGGVFHVARELSFDLEAIGGYRYEALPRDVRRLGGVGCLACHGPGAVPAESARWAILRSDVCATCHDAPPRYGHVAAWRASAMSRSDVAEGTRSEPCARCHTTDGFLLAQGALPAPRPPPAAAGGLGVTCVACHAVHDPAGATPRLLRRARPADWLGAVAGGPSALCASCHAPERRGLPGPSAAALWAGRGGLDPDSGAPIAVVAEHAATGCIDCHKAGPSELSRGRSHAFRADPETCRNCHAKLPAVQPLQAELDRRARALWDKLVELRAVPPPLVPHVTREALDVTTPLGRAAFNVMLVLEDRAAASHGAGYARALLDAAEPTIEAGGKRP